MLTRFIDSIFPNSRLVDWLFPGRATRRKRKALCDVLWDLRPDETPFYTLIDRDKRSEREG